MLSPTIILSISVLVDAHTLFEMAISDVQIVVETTIAITVTVTGRNFKSYEQTK